MLTLTPPTFHTWTCFRKCYFLADQFSLAVRELDVAGFSVSRPTFMLDSPSAEANAKMDQERTHSHCVRTVHEEVSPASCIGGRAGEGGGGGGESRGGMPAWRHTAAGLVRLEAVGAGRFAQARETSRHLIVPSHVTVYSIILNSTVF
jgi:hypothetical protein